MVHPDKLKGPNSGTSMLLALSKCQNMNVKSQEHRFCSMLKWKRQVSCGALSFVCDFSVLSKDEAQQLDPEGLDEKRSFSLTIVATMLLIFPSVSTQSVVQQSNSIQIMSFISQNVFVHLKRMKIGFLRI